MSGAPGFSSGLAAAFALACASAPPPPPPPPDWNDALRTAASELADRLRAEPVAEGAQVVVRLAFTREADLDLYVTDPPLETVYYANTPARTGGRLEQDHRCDDADAEAIRVETVRFEAAPAGRYRVGVDYPHRCEGGDEVVPYAVSIEANGERSLHAGLARWLDFTTVATEFDVK
jgi:hypothetical protein